MYIVVTGIVVYIVTGVMMGMGVMMGIYGIYVFLGISSRTLPEYLLPVQNRRGFGPGAGTSTSSRSDAAFALTEDFKMRKSIYSGDLLRFRRPKGPLGNTSPLPPACFTYVAFQTGDQPSKKYFERGDISLFYCGHNSQILSTEPPANYAKIQRRDSGRIRFSDRHPPTPSSTSWFDRFQSKTEF